MKIFILGVTLGPTIILGDFNIYNDYELPLHYLTGGEANIKLKCKVSVQHQDVKSEPGIKFRDSWKTSHVDGENGYTFSNMVSFMCTYQTILW